jgi:LacI family transcriptional regulator
MARIAELVGVSVPTVSKVLNHREGVADHTRAIIEQALADNGYSRRTRRHAPVTTIDLLLTGADSQWGSLVFMGADSEAQRQGIDLVATMSSDEPGSEERWLSRIIHRGSDGVVAVVTELSPTTMAVLQREGIAIVLLEPVGPPPAGVCVIAATNWAGGLLGTEHLISLGHRRIGFISGPEREICMADRLDGYGAALRRAGIEFDPELVRPGDSLVTGGRREGAALLDLPDPPTAIFSCSDEQAYGVYEAARQRGLRIPQDLSVVGFDDVNLAQWVSPQLTTVRQPVREMGMAAVRHLVDLASGAEVVSHRHEVATTLVERASTAKAPKAPKAPKASKTPKAPKAPKA